jgi:hypothetical protein
MEFSMASIDGGVSGGSGRSLSSACHISATNGMDASL